MTAQTKEVLKSYFNTGDNPSEGQLVNLIDTIGAVTLTIAASDASNASKGRADYICDGTDDQVQIQAAIDALPSIGGRVLLSEGTFTLTTAGMNVVNPGGDCYYCIEIRATDPPLELAGIPGATTIILADDQSDEPFMIHILGANGASRTNLTRITGIKFDGNGTNQIAPPSSTFFDIICIQFSENVTIDHCYFTNWQTTLVPPAYRVAIMTGCKSHKFKITNCYFYGIAALACIGNYQLVSNNIFEDDTSPDTTGLSLLELSPDYDIEIREDVPGNMWGTVVTGNIFMGGSYSIHATAIHGVTISGNTFMDTSDINRYAILIQSDTALTGFDSTYNTIIGNTLVNCGSGIKFQGDAATGVKNSIIALNTIGGGLDRNPNWGIIEGGGTTGNNLIINNYVEGGSGKIVSTGTGTIVRGNIGYKTENHGAAASIADGGTIDHGLAATPTWANVTPSVAGEMATVTTLDATHITVAIKKHDGTAGTTQTIYWEAEV